MSSGVIMAQHSPAPQFGNWEDNENVPYSAYFERVRKGRNHGTTQSNREENSGAYRPGKLPDRASSPKVGGGVRAPEPVFSRHDRTDGPTYHVLKDRRNPAGIPSSYSGVGMPRSEAEVQNKLQHPNMVRLKHERLTNREDGWMKSTNSSNRSPRPTAGTGYSAEYLNHRSYSQDSPSRVRESTPKSSSHGAAPTTPGRSRLRLVAQGNKSPDQERAVPKFGDWNEKDPSSGNSYTQIFNRARDEKQHGPAASHAIKTEQDNSSTQVQKAHGYEKPQKCSCFPWLGK